VAVKHERLDLEARTVAVFLAALVALIGFTAFVRATPRTVTALAIGGLLALPRTQSWAPSDARLACAGAGW
jgi:hypothetical protein